MSEELFYIKSNDQMVVNSADLLNEEIDGEVIIVHMIVGNYYSLRGVGNELWSWLQEPISMADFLEKVSHHFKGDWVEVMAAIRGFLEALQKDELLIIERGQGAELPLPSELSGSELFEQPVLEKYTDMKDLLLLDPIHEVDDKGWPHAKPQ